MTTRTMNNHIISKPVKIKQGYWTVVTRYTNRGEQVVVEKRESRGEDRRGAITVAGNWELFVYMFESERLSDNFITSVNQF